MMETLGFMKVNDHSSQTLVNPKNKAIVIYNSFNSLTDLVTEIFDNHYTIDENGCVVALSYGDTLLNVSTLSKHENPTVDEMMRDYPNLMSLVMALIDSNTGPVFVMKFICDVSNLLQINIYDSPLYPLMINLMKEFKFSVHNVREITLNTMSVSTIKKLSSIDTHFKYQWVFSV